MGSVGLNLQKKCSTVFLYDTPLNDAVRIQAIGRVRRWGSNAKFVTIIEYSVPGTMADRLELRQLRQSLPGMFAELDKQLIDPEGDVFNTEKTIIANWVSFTADGKKRLYRSTDDEVKHLHLPPVTLEEFLRHLRLPALAQTELDTGWRTYVMELLYRKSRLINMI